MRFKVGDRVRVISDAYGTEQLGKTGVVDEVNRPRNLDVQIEYDTPLRGVKKNQYSSEHLELIVSAGPIVTETVQRIEPGVYGRLYVKQSEDFRDQVVGHFVSRGNNPYELHNPLLNAPELRELARVALEIAEYLDAQ